MRTSWSTRSECRWAGTPSRRLCGRSPARLREFPGLPADSQPPWASSYLVRARFRDEPACKPDSVAPKRADDHPSATVVTDRLRRFRRATYPGASCEQHSNGVRGPGGPSWSCSRWGLPSHPSHLGCWWSLTPPFHPYPVAGAVCSLWHFPAGHPGWALPTTLLCGVRTFLDLRRDHPADSSASQGSPNLAPGQPGRIRNSTLPAMRSADTSVAAT